MHMGVVCGSPLCITLSWFVKYWVRSPVESEDRGGDDEGLKEKVENSHNREGEWMSWKVIWCLLGSMKTHAEVSGCEF